MADNLILILRIFVGHVNPGVASSWKGRGGTGLEGKGDMECNEKPVKKRDYISCCRSEGGDRTYHFLPGCSVE